MMIIAPNSHTHKGEKERGKVKEEFEEGNADYREMEQPSQQQVAPWVKLIECEFGTRGLRMLAAYTGGRCSPTLIDTLPTGHPFSCLI